MHLVIHLEIFSVASLEYDKLEEDFIDGVVRASIIYINVFISTEANQVLPRLPKRSALIRPALTARLWLTCVVLESECLNKTSAPVWWLCTSSQNGDQYPKEVASLNAGSR